jgi:hypothetical protein
MYGIEPERRHACFVKRENAEFTAEATEVVVAAESTT